LSDAGEPKDDVDLPPAPLGTALAADFAFGKDLRVTTRAALDEEMVRRAFLLVLAVVTFFATRADEVPQVISYREATEAEAE